MKSLALSILFLCLLTHAHAQVPIIVTNAEQTMSKGSHTAFSITIPQAQKKDVDDAWAKAVKQKSKSKAAQIGNELVIIGTLIPLITTDSLNIYATTVATTEGVKLDAYFETKAGFIQADNASLVLPAQKFVHDFAVSAYKKAVTDELNIENEKLQDLEQELKGLAKEEDKLVADIKKKETQISNIKNDIIANEGDQATKRNLIQAQKQKVESAKKVSKDSEAAEVKNLKALEKELDALIKTNEKLHAKITDLETGIRENGREIDTLKQNQGLKNEAIGVQKQRVQLVTTKLNGIQ
ncbi:MAG: hypothetical protein SFW35_09200 [Chitinophagales bacterium]|nr:hypothetical protein [Chitinophagales bacterium]